MLSATLIKKLEYHKFFCLALHRILMNEVQLNINILGTMCLSDLVVGDAHYPHYQTENQRLKLVVGKVLMNKPGVYLQSKLERKRIFEHN